MGDVMVLTPWLLVVLTILVASLLVLFGVGLRLFRRTTLVTTAVALFCLSGFFLYTLILDECCLARDFNSITEDAAIIGVPALAGVVLVAIATKLTRKRTEPTPESKRL
jgi:uncharacterized membrane protein YphA (DoxX/SURF4 family)